MIAAARLGLAAVLVMAGAALAEPASAASAAIRRGAALAASNCAACHATGLTGASPNPKSPPFVEVGQRYADLRLDWELEAIAEVGHYQMPARPLTAGQINDLVAYIRDLNRQAARRGPVKVDRP